MKPYRHEDDEHDWLTIAERDGLRAEDTAVIRACDNGVEITRADLPVITGKLYEACGLPAPVILERPNLTGLGTEDSPVARAGFKVWRSAKGVHLTEVFPAPPEDGWSEPAHALELAAVIAVLAERPPEPDPAEVGALALVIAGDCSAGIEAAKPTARKILLAGYAKGARDA
jgi:hypothetical protein